MRGGARERGQQVQPLFLIKNCDGVRNGTPTPAITTSYFSSVPVGSNLGLRRGRGDANDGRLRRSRDKVEYSVKTGIFSRSWSEGWKSTLDSSIKGKC